MKLTMEKDTEKSNGNAENTNNTESNSNESEQLIEMEKIENTPFTLIKQNGIWNLTMGKYKMGESKEKETLLKQVEEKTWDLLMQVTTVLIKEIE